MATFPALKPSSRTFTPGIRPHSEIRTMNGGHSRVRQSNVLLDQRLRLTFVALTETQMLSIRTHYIEQQGRFYAFTIPNDLLSGVTTPTNFTPTGYRWIYGATPIIQDIGLQRYTVSIELVTVPYEGANINGADLSVSITFRTVTAMNLVVTVSFAAGAATGSIGMITITLDAGVATGA